MTAFAGPDPTDAQKKDPEALTALFRDYYAKSGNRAGIVVGAFVLCLAAIALLVFANELRARLAGSGAERAGQLTFAGAIVFAATAIAGAATVAWIPGAIWFGGVPGPTGEINYLSSQLGFGIFLIGAGVSVALMLTTGGWAAARTGVLASWIGWAGVVIGVLLFVGAALFLPMLLLVLWSLIASISMLRRGIGDV